MKVLYIAFALLFCCRLEAQNNLTLWYNKPAAKWVEALPLGNGKIGAMVFGRVDEELIQLNESTLWSGGPVQTNVNPESSSYLPLIRDALLNGEDYSKADELTKKMQGLFTESYLPMGDVTIRQDLHGATPSRYYRDLSISTATATTKFVVNGVTYTREMFISAPDNVMVMRFTASKKGTLSFTIRASSQLHYTVSTSGNKVLMVSGKAPAHVAPNYYNPKGKEPIVYEDTSGCNGMRYQFSLQAVKKDGTVLVDTAGIHVINATEVIIYLTAATSFNGFDKCPDQEGKDEKALAQSFLSAAMAKGYPLVRSRHEVDFKRYFNRVSFSLKDTSKTKGKMALLPSNERLQAYTNGGCDPSLETLYFQFGRYLLISCSRPGGPPANLQGIWNKEIRAPWSSNYTININTEMNYWPAEETGLSEMHEPLLHWINELAQTGRVTAKEFYGADGWVAHHNSDIWAQSNAVGDKGSGDPVWANWAMGGNWLSRHLWEHYLFTGDTAFLRKDYPVLKSAAEFSLSWLVEDKNGYLVTAPSTTPENKFKDSSGKEQGVSVATTMDMSIIRDLFSHVIDAANVLQTDAAFRDTLIARKAKLFPMHIGSKGQLLEWYKEFEETDPQHRHVSHLFGLYPGTEINPYTTPGLFAAAKKTLAVRGDGGTGWSKGWKINWWARLLDGNHAYKLIRELLTYVDDTNVHYSGGGGTYANFFDAHPPFQIDGNFAGTAGMAEMLLQSQAGEVFLLPALPDAWKEGFITGLRARGAFTVSMQWANNKLVAATLVSNNRNGCKLRTAMPVAIKGVAAKSVLDCGSYVTSFATKKNGVYLIRPM